MSLWEVMLSIFWFMLLVAWFWLLITIVTDIFRDSALSGWAKAAWCLFVLLLPWIGVLTYLLARGRSMNERAMQASVDNEQAFRRYVQQAAGSGPGIADELDRLAKLYAQGTISAEDYEAAKRRVLADTPPVPPTTTTPSSPSGMSA
jgi:hypothetical protein